LYPENIQPEPVLTPSAEIAPTTTPNETPSTQEYPQPQKDQITSTPTIAPDGVTTRVKSPTGGGFGKLELKKDGVRIV
jgi:hypothetical protein